MDGTLIDVRMDGLASGGDAVGRQAGGAHAGRATFVALAAPGETVTARLTREKARVAWAELTAIRTPSPSRVPPPCPLFGRCGGCQWQHVDLPTQRAAKQAMVERALGGPAAATTAAAVPLIAPVESGRGYRERARLTVGADGAVGFRARRSHQVVDVAQCWLLAPELAAPLAAIRAAAASLPAQTEIDLQLGNDGVHVALSPPVAAPAPRGSPRARHEVDGPSLLAAWRPSGIVGVQVIGRGSSRSFGMPDVDVAERDSPPLRIPAGAFSQVGRAANAALVRAVLDALGPAPGVVLELYAGSGNFTRHLVGRAARLVACDADAAAVARGRRQVAGATWAERPPSPIDADVVLCDPPREGLDPENLTAARAARGRIVYVSCDPQTLGRDAARLAEAGFVLRSAVALDLMSHTFHVEVVATFDRV